MRSKGLKKGLFVLGTMGIILLGTAIFAEQIGMDNDSGWGKGRILILMTGIFLISANILIAVFQDNLLKLTGKMSVLTGHISQIYIFTFLATIIVLASYTWLIAPGFNQPNTNYYSQLAIAFKRNQLSLPEEPSTALLSLSNPYDYTLRKDSNVEDFPWDVSLYQGKFYLYWGPVPSLILTILSNERLAHMGDQYLVFAFLCGLFLYSVLFVSSFWLRFNYNPPGWTIGLALVAIGISSPATLMLNNPQIYEAAIVGCQFFFIGGCYWAYNAISEKDSPAIWKLVLAGTHWALAFGTRITILPAIIFTAVATLIYILRESKIANPKKILLTLSAMGIPFLIAAVGLSWYNWMRFESIFEFGLRFQLASANYNEFNSLFSARYMYENFLNYFIRPYQIQAVFPYIKTIENVVSNDRLAGLLYTSPYILLILIPLCLFLYSSLVSKKFDEIDQNKNPVEKWLVATLTGSSLLALVIILSYYFTAMRFTEDFMPALLLLSTICLGQGYKLIGENGNLRKGYIFLVTLLAVFSITASTLIALPGSRVKDVLYYMEQINQLFGIR